MLASLLFPYDDDAPSLIDGWLAELEEQASIRRYQIDGTSYVQVTEWTKHQKIDKPSPSKIPPFPTNCDPIVKPPFVDASRILAKALETSSGDQGSRIKDQGRDQDQGSKPARAAPWLTADDLIADGLSATTAVDFIEHRRAKRAKLTRAAWEGFKREVLKAPGWTNEAAALKAIARNWTAFEAAWVAEAGAKGRGATQESFRERDNRIAAERVYEFTGGHLGRAPAAPSTPTQEIFDVTPRRLDR
jgi:hypothetical protein